ncbi:MAG TPA: acyltransferase [Rhizomicrobium sp.]|jgi:peptidoglycan/LPS O-acetylase OafA/YrhL|nr:acyltransferase [Rhizomicrobium sp.]
MNAEPQWMPREPRAIPAIDNLRSVVILLVIAIHVLLPYFTFLPAKPYAFSAPPWLWRSFPLVDTHRLLGFDILSAWVDVFVMATFFLISGLFVWPCLARKGAKRFIGERVFRLGLPFAVVVLVAMPLATAPTYLQTAAHPSLVDFCRRFLALPFWPAGPMWFLWVLLLFDAVAAGLFVLFPRINALVVRLSLYARAKPLRFAAAVIAASAAGYIPLALLFGPLPWGQFGPFSLQLCRPAQYAVYFFAGVVIGACGIERELTGVKGRLARHWRGATALAILCFGLWLLASAVAMTKASAPLGLRAADAAAYVLACFASCWAAVALTTRFAGSRGPVWHSLRDNAYGIYLVHYVFAFWVQFALLGTDVPAIVKASVVFVSTLALSWATAALLRRVPGVGRVIGTGRRTDGHFARFMHPVIPLAD